MIETAENKPKTRDIQMTQHRTGCRSDWSNNVRNATTGVPASFIRLAFSGSFPQQSRIQTSLMNQER